MPTGAAGDSRIAEAELELRASLAAGEFRRAASLVVKAYGDEVHSFLASLHSSREVAEEVFAMACADLVRGLPQYKGLSQLRTWFYSIAKNASRRWFSDGYHRRRTELLEASNLAQPERTRTADYLRTEWKRRLARLKESLDPEDRSLLVLRVDRGMEWSEIAAVLGDAARSSPGRASGMLRKRFERIKGKLRRAAVEDGWLAEE